jgi:hypothetical protein
MSRMKVISLWQPWASLIAVGGKEYETRSWATRYRGKIAIHAAKTRDHLSLGYQQPFYDVLIDSGWYSEPEKLPLGAIVAIAELTAIYRADELYPKISEQERAFGLYGDGRFAWRLQNVKPLNLPFQVSGKQGLWDCEIPDDIELINS